MQTIHLQEQKTRTLHTTQTARRHKHLAPPTPFRIIDMHHAARLLRQFTQSQTLHDLLAATQEVTQDTDRNSIIIALSSYYEWEPRIQPQPHKKGYWQNGSALLGYWQHPDEQPQQMYWDITADMLRGLCASEHHDGIHLHHDHHGLLRDGAELVIGSERLELVTHSVHTAVQRGIISKGIGTEISAVTSAYLECPVIHIGQDTHHFKLILPYDANGKSGAYLYLVKIEEQHPHEGIDELLVA